MSISVLKIGERLKGRLSVYTLAKQLYPTVWLARDADNRPVIIKHDKAERIANEVKFLQRFQNNALFRPMVDEIEISNLASPALVLKHYDCHIGDISKERGLSTQEARLVGSRVLQALAAIHATGHIHTDIKPGNILVNRCSDSEIRFNDVCVADLGDVVSVDSQEATCGYPLGTGVFRSPETTMMMPYTTAHDIWSFGATLISLLYGGGFDIFWPNGRGPEHELFLDGIVKNFHKYFGPFPVTYLTLPGIDGNRIEALTNITLGGKERGLFQRASSTEISNQDRDFIWGFMKLDYRDRPTATELLENKWFTEPDTPEAKVCVESTDEKLMQPAGGRYMK